MERLTIANPRKKGRGRKRRNPFLPVQNPIRSGRQRRRSNPEIAVIENPRRRSFRKKKNPFAIKQTVTEALQLAAPVVAGIYGCRYLTRAILGNKDTGVLGYGANLGVAIGLSIAAQVMGYTRAASLIAAGGFAATGLRVLVDKFPKTGQYSVFGDDGAGTNDYLLNAQRLQGLGIPELDLPPVQPDEEQYQPYLWGMGDYIQPR